jgi:D-alanyl-D-alanine carboxypeptidase
MERRIRNRWLNAFALGCLAVILLPAVNNPTPAKAVNPTTYSIDEANSLWVVVNKQRPLKPLRYEPKDLVVPKFGTALNSNPYGRQVRADVAKAAIDLARAMNAAGQGKLVIQSGYRPFAEQKSIHARQVKRYGKKVGEALAARPGYSEHQTGLAIDVSARGQGCQIRVCFGQTKAGLWLKANAYKYGFITRYPKYATFYTGYQYEPWHLRYIGVDLATQLHEAKVITLEKFFLLPAAPNY